MIQKGDEYLNSYYPEEIRDKISRLVSDERYKAYRGAKIDLDAVAHNYSIATSRGAWELKTQRERLEWQAKFDKLVGQLLYMMREGPFPPEAWGFPAHDHILMNVAQRMGVDIPSSNDVDAYWGKMLELERVANESGWTIEREINYYLECAKFETAPQFIKKPRDEKADRATFIYCLREDTEMSASGIALVASILFDDECIDERLVRKITAPGKIFPKT